MSDLPTNAALSDPLINSSREFFGNPYPAFKRFREEAPVFWSEKGQYWLVTCYADAHDILGDLHFEKGARRYKQIDMIAELIPNDHPILEQRGKNLLNMNPPTTRACADW